MSEPKSLGQIAFEAYETSQGFTNHPYSWEHNLDYTQQQAWQAAAGAVFQLGVAWAFTDDPDPTKIKPFAGWSSEVAINRPKRT